MSIPDRLVLPLMRSLRDCLSLALVDSVGGLPDILTLAPGQAIAHEGCGQAWVRLDLSSPSARFPTLQGSVSPKIDPFAVRLQMGVVRCTATGSSAEMPSVDEMEHDVEEQMSDYAAMLRAVQCCYDSGPDRRPYVIGTYAPFGPQGGLTGGTLLVTVQR